MKTKMTSARRRILITGVAACVGIAFAGPALAQSAAPSDNLSVNLVNLLVKQGVITQAAGDGLLAEARRQTAEAQATAQTRPGPSGEDMKGAEAALAVAAQALAQAQARLGAVQTAQQVAPVSGTTTSVAMASGPNLPPVAPGATRIPYVPAPVKNEIRDEIIRLAKAENWAQPNAIPEWTQRIRISGDVRARDANDLYSRDNQIDIINFAALNARGPVDINPLNGLLDLPFLNTLRTRANQFQIRARLDVRAEAGDWVTTDVRLATGTENSPVSTTQALGGGLSKKSVWLDRAYIDVHPRPWVNATFGRMPNPFFSTDLVYDTDLNFDGGALHGALSIWPDAGVSLFATGGLILTDYQDLDFPNASRSDQKSASERKWLIASQVGGEWKTDLFRWKTGLAYYSFRGAQGRLSTPCAVYLGVRECSTDETRPAFMQKGNTLFFIRNIIPNPNDPNHTQDLQFAGLTFPFHILNLTSTLDVPFEDGRHLVLTGDYARNLAYKFSETCRYGDFGLPVTNVVNVGALCSDPATGPRIHSGPNAFMARANYGHPDPDRFGQWNVTAGYKRLAGDSVLDAYTDADFHLGGTNAKGYFLEATLGVATNTNIQFRWFSANEVTGPPMSIDLGQIEINSKF